MFVVKLDDKTFRPISNPIVISHFCKPRCPVCGCGTRSIVEVKLERGGKLFYGHYYGCAACGERSDMAIRED